MSKYLLQVTFCEVRRAGFEVFVDYWVSGEAKEWEVNKQVIEAREIHSVDLSSNIFYTVLFTSNKQFIVNTCSTFKTTQGRVIKKVFRKEGAVLKEYSRN